ncbi:hypothetical protein BGZ73_009252 [Actinomortierella ambigua]|nr:hypothetical protein BGZ73_009252 [Actinomortierella ambigua]
MPKVLYRFPTGEGLVHLLDPSFFDHVQDEEPTASKPPSSSSTKGNHRVGPRLQIQAVHQAAGVGLNGVSTVAPSLTSIAHALARFRFYQLVCDFDETITEHDTTSMLDELRRYLYDDDGGVGDQLSGSSPPQQAQVPPPPPPTPLDPPVSQQQQYFQPLAPTAIQKSHPPAEPRWTWDEILDAYLNDLANVHVGDLDHLHCDRKVSKESCCHDDSDNHDHGSAETSDTSPTTAKASSGKTAKMTASKTELAQQQTADPCLIPWFQSQVRRRVAEEVSMRRVHDSGNLAGLTADQIRAFARARTKLRPGLVDLLAARAAVTSTAETGKGFVQEGEQRGQTKQQQQTLIEKKQEQADGFWILSVNWSQDLIRGAMDQVFERPEVTDKVLPASRLVCSNLEFGGHHHQPHHQDQQGHQQQPLPTDQITATATAITTTTTTTVEHHSHSHSHEDHHEHALSVSTGRVHIRCLTGCDKLEAFREMQAMYAEQQGLTLLDTQWAFLGDSSNDLGCLVEADLGIIIGTSKSLLAECMRLGIQIVDLEIIQDTE